MGKAAAESLHRPDAAATADAAAAILIERSGCARLFPCGRRGPREAPRALIPPPPALDSPPALPLGLRTHAARSAPRRGPLAALPFLFRPASPPSAHPLGASAPRPAPPGSPSAAGRETAASAAARGEGGPGESKMAAAAHSRSRLRGVAHDGPLRRRRGPASAALTPALELRHFPSGLAKGSGRRFLPHLPSPRCVGGGGVGHGDPGRCRRPGGHTALPPRALCGRNGPSAWPAAASLATFSPAGSSSLEPETPEEMRNGGERRPHGQLLLFTREGP